MDAVLGGRATRRVTAVAAAQVYRGPERARPTGRIGGARVARTFTRTNGCGISAYDHLRPLVPRPRPPAPGPAPHRPPC